MFVFLYHPPHHCLKHMVFNPATGWLTTLFQAGGQKMELDLEEKKKVHCPEQSNFF